MDESLREMIERMTASDLRRAHASCDRAGDHELAAILSRWLGLDQPAPDGDLSAAPS